MSSLSSRALLVFSALTQLACGRVGVELLRDALVPNDGGSEQDAAVADASAQSLDAALDATDDGGIEASVDAPVADAFAADASTDDASTDDAAADDGSASDASVADAAMDPCVPRTETFGFGSFTASAGTCTRMTIRLWGAGGASGDAQGGYWGASTKGGLGGPGGFVQQTFVVSATSDIRIYVGQGGQGCGAPGSNAQTIYNGGAGATSRAGNGTRGNDGTATGGAGANPSEGGRGGAGSFGGGGGGGGAGPAFAPFGSAGGGGSASVVLVDAARLVAGGGGGGGGAGTNVSTTGVNGGNGGSGCAANGMGSTPEGGGGGGGGVCQGAANTARGTGTSPADAANELPVGVAAGASNDRDCVPGGSGYAIVSFDSP